ncbi:hypothetical protein [Mycobacterium marinum]|uniref:hypothetical protein n=1 Tax=Mycobacterium marinum TaxID=1781 RepID=UPI002359D147|nr:hypothetical protein [Mycobacterium marinum]MDC8985526.1 hypothetical protein [Mycobacterium marinum]MDC9002830.1 hypothetical protein [Mycobacterium marinum]MDC9013563.1 hypothetical protein [Mycobacterium marinum]MDC9018913.1 hypothetical protein [Mycobacterium marinum]
MQALMALLGHVSTQMSLRYAHLLDHTVRIEYELGPELAKSHIGPLLTITAQLPITGITSTGWKDTPAIRSRYAGGF